MEVLRQLGGGVTAVLMAAKTKAVAREGADRRGILEVKLERPGGSCKTRARRGGILHSSLVQVWEDGGGAAGVEHTSQSSF